LLKAIARTSASVPAGVALALSVTTSGVVPVPPVNVPIVVPTWVTFAPEVAICPWLRIVSRSSADPPTL
jgi:hypothetical protein